MHAHPFLGDGQPVERGIELGLQLGPSHHVRRRLAGRLERGELDVELRQASPGRSQDPDHPVVPAEPLRGHLEQLGGRRRHRTVREGADRDRLGSAGARRIGPVRGGVDEHATEPVDRRHDLGRVLGGRRDTTVTQLLGGGVDQLGELFDVVGVVARCGQRQRPGIAEVAERLDQRRGELVGRSIDVGAVRKVGTELFDLGLDALRAGLCRVDEADALHLGAQGRDAHHVGAVGVVAQPVEQHGLLGAQLRHSTLVARRPETTAAVTDGEDLVPDLFEAGDDLGIDHGGAHRPLGRAGRLDRLVEALGRLALVELQGGTSSGQLTRLGQEPLESIGELHRHRVELGGRLDGACQGIGGGLHRRGVDPLGAFDPGVDRGAPGEQLVAGLRPSGPLALPVGPEDRASRLHGLDLSDADVDRRGGVRVEVAAVLLHPIGELCASGGDRSQLAAQLCRAGPADRRIAGGPLGGRPGRCCRGVGMLCVEPEHRVDVRVELQLVQRGPVEGETYAADLQRPPVTGGGVVGERPEDLDESASQLRGRVLQDRHPWMQVECRASGGDAVDPYEPHCSSWCHLSAGTCPS